MTDAGGVGALEAASAVASSSDRAGGAALRSPGAVVRPLDPPP